MLINIGKGRIGITFPKHIDSGKRYFGLTFAREESASVEYIAIALTIGATDLPFALFVKIGNHGLSTWSYHNREFGERFGYRWSRSHYGAK